MAQSTTGSTIADPNAQDELRNEIKDIKTQLQTLLEALNLGNGQGNDHREEGEEHVDQRRSEVPQTSNRSVSEHVNDNEVQPLASDNILGVIAETQRQLAQALIQNSRPLQVHSTGDTAAAIQTFEGNKRESLKEWLEEIERVASLAHWTQSLTMLNAITRLRGAARDWHKSYGTRIHDWDTWKLAIAERFKRKMSLQEFLDYQNERQLRPNETLVQYMYAKNAMLEKAPQKLGPEERISLILSGIQDDKWAMPLATHNCTSVLELIDRAMNLDNRRKLEVQSSTEPKQLSNYKPFGQRQSSQWSTQRPSLYTNSPNDRRCFNCSGFGHISRDCPQPMSTATLRAEDRRTKKQDESHSHHERNVHCFLRTRGDTLPIVTAYTNGGSPLRACIDTGANVSIVDPKVLPPNQEKTACSGHELVTVLDRQVEPQWTTTLSIDVGQLTIRLPEVLVLPLPSTMDILLGSDWRKLANVDVTFHVSNDITLVKLPARDVTQRDETSKKPQRTGEALISTFAMETTQHIDNDVAMFVSFHPSRSSPDLELEQKINAAVDLMTPEASSEERERLHEILMTHHAAFATKQQQLGMCPHTEHSIELRNSIPVASRPYRCSYADRELMREKVDEYMKQGVIKPSQSEYAAPTLIIDQPNHPTTPRRMVHDYRKLNAKTLNPPYPMPLMEDALDEIMRDHSRYFSTIDVKTAFLTVRVKPEDTHKTAFVTPDGKYEYLRMAFGFCKAPQTMQMVMRKTFEGLPRTTKYIDDIAQGARSITEALELLEESLRRVVLNGLRIDIRKCQFVRNQVSFLGYIITEEGRIPDPKRVADVDKFQPSRDAKHLYSFLQFANHFRRFIENFSAKTLPLRKLLAKDSEFAWSEENQNIVDCLKHALKNPPILANFRSDCPSTVHTDASQHGLGAILTQTQDAQERVIEYASRALNAHDSQFHSNLLECMALHWAVTEKFSIYLKGGPQFTVLTDNLSLTYLAHKATANRRFARWTIELSDYDFKICHRPGRVNKADALSRLEDLDREPESLQLNGTASRGIFICMVLQANNSCLREHQKTDGDCQRLQLLVDKGNTEFAQKHGILVKLSTDGSGPKVVVPAVSRDTVLQMCHDSTGHMDAQRTLNQIQRRYWWPCMSRHVRAYVQSCHTCRRVNRRTTIAEGSLQPRTIPAVPNTVISLDHFGPLKECDGYQHVLVCIDHATRYVDAVAVPSTASVFYLDFLMNRWIPRFGVPKTIVTDQAKGFVNKRTAAVHRRFGITHVTTPPYWPQANGLVERAVGVLKNVLRKIIEPHSDWSKMLPEAVFAVNVARQNSTQHTPFELMHGYDPRLPGQLCLSDVEEELNEASRLSKLAKKRDRARENLEGSQASAKQRYDANRRTPNFQIGDTVYCTLGSRSSTLDPFFDGPYRVSLILGENTVKIVRIDQSGNRRNERVVNVEQLRRHTTRDISCPELADTILGRQLQQDLDSNFETEASEPLQNLGSDCETEDPEQNQPNPDHDLDEIELSGDVDSGSPTREIEATGVLPTRPSRTRRIPVHLKDYEI